MIANEQAALRRVATLVVRQSTPEELFAAVALKEVAHVLDARCTSVIRYDANAIATPVGVWGRREPIPR